MRERTVTISSGGKTFSFTGWKIGWVCAPPELVDRGAHGQAVPHLRQRRAVPARASRSGSARRRATSAGCADLRDEARPAVRAGWPPPGSRCCRPPAPTSSPPTSAARRARRPRVLPRAARALRRRRGARASCSTTTASGRPLVRFAFCKRLEVHRRGRRRGCRSGVDEGRRDPARHRVGGPGRDLRAPRPMIANAAAGRERDSSCSARCSRPASRWTPSASPSRRRPERAVPRRAGGRARRLGVRLGARAARTADERPSNNARARRARRRRCTATPRSTRSRTRGEHEQYARRRRSS